MTKKPQDRMSSVEDSPARIFRQPTQRAKGSTAQNPGYGSNFTESFAYYDLDTSSWRTCQTSLIKDLTEYSRVGPKSGMMLNGRCYQRPSLERGICDEESLLLPTPTASTERSASKQNLIWSGLTTVYRQDGAKVQIHLSDAVHRLLLPTPQANRIGGKTIPQDAKWYGLTQAVTGKKKMQVPLETAVKRLFPTPTASLQGGTNQTLCGREVGMGLGFGGNRQYVRNPPKAMADPDGSRCEKQRRTLTVFPEQFASKHFSWWEAKPGICRVYDGIPNRVDRLKSLGNAVVPQVAEYLGKLILNHSRRACEASGQDAHSYESY